jgi:hypothetical protein
VSGAAHFLARLVGALDRANVPYMLAGSFASSVHGTPRSTQDVDIVVDPTFATLDALLTELADPDLYVDRDVARAELRQRGQFNVIDASSGWKADFVFRKARTFSIAEIGRRMPMTILGVAAYVATAEDTVLAKLEWSKLGASERQLDDVRRIVEVKSETLDRAYVESWVDDLGVRELWERVR